MSVTGEERQKSIVVSRFPVKVKNPDYFHFLKEKHPEKEVSYPLLILL